MSETAERERPRHRVIRTGEREPIDPYKRRLIYERDGYTCGHCGLGVAPTCEAPGEKLQLDHVEPWSAGGSDRSDNLRTLCGPCNEDRSNFVDDYPPRLIGVTRGCFWCRRRRGKLLDLYIEADVADLDRIPAYCGACGGTSWVPDREWFL